MTYCCGILVREGLVMFADTRTNAGVDNIATFRKLHVFKDPGKRIMALASAGNLSISQSVVSILTEGYDNPETGERETLMNSPTMFQARAARRPRHPHLARDRRQGARSVRCDVRRFLSVRRTDCRRTHAAVHDLFRRQFHRMHHRHAVPADRRAQIRQAGPRPRRRLRHGSLRCAQGRPDLHRLDHAVEPQRRHADRPPGRAARHLRCRTDLPDRAGRTVFLRPARALVGRVARRPHRHSAPALRRTGKRLGFTQH